MNSNEPLDSIYEFMEMLVAKYGVAGIATAMFAESAGLPFASAVVLIVSGSMIISGKVSFWAIFFASTAGITLGSIFSYFVGYVASLFGQVARASNYLHSFETMEAFEEQKPASMISRFWSKYGNFSIFMGQLWGVTRTFISFPAGAMHMNFIIFIIYTTLGGALFSLFMIGLSIALTGTMNLTIKWMLMLAELSPWLLLLPLAAALALVFFLRRSGWYIITDSCKTLYKNVFNKKG